MKIINWCKNVNSIIYEDYKTIFINYFFVIYSDTYELLLWKTISSVYFM